MGITSGASMATHILVHEREAIPAPSGMDLTTAAAIPEVFMTAYDALCLQAKMRPGETVLIHSVGSGVGTAAIQIASAFGATVVGSSRTESKLARCTALGLEYPILVREGQFLAELKLAGIKADVILDTVGAAYLEQNIRALAPRGRMVVIGLLGGATGTAPLGLLLVKRATLIGSVLRSRPLEEKCSLAQSFSREILPFFESGRFKAVVDRIFPMAHISQAHALMESNESFGKIILEWTED
jgi:NADPH:quinone reductase-like Zn-dependent oxidoreductase